MVHPQEVGVVFTIILCVSLTQAWTQYGGDISHSNTAPTTASFDGRNCGLDSVYDLSYEFSSYPSDLFGAYEPVIDGDSRMVLCQKGGKNISAFLVDPSAARSTLLALNWSVSLNASEGAVVLPPTFSPDDGMSTAYAFVNGSDGISLMAFNSTTGHKRRLWTLPYGVWPAGAPVVTTSQQTPHVLFQYCAIASNDTNDGHSQGYERCGMMGIPLSSDGANHWNVTVKNAVSAQPNSLVVGQSGTDEAIACGLFQTSLSPSFASIGTLACVTLDDASSVRWSMELHVEGSRVPMSGFAMTHIYKDVILVAPRLRYNFTSPSPDVTFVFDVSTGTPQASLPGKVLSVSSTHYLSAQHIESIYPTISLTSFESGDTIGVFGVGNSAYQYNARPIIYGSMNHRMLANTIAVYLYFYGTRAYDGGYVYILEANASQSEPNTQGEYVQMYSLEYTKSNASIPITPSGVAMHTYGQGGIATRGTVRFYASCNGHGYCKPHYASHGAHTCACNELFFGDQCTYFCSSKECSAKLHGHGACNSSGDCVCAEHYYPMDNCSVFCSPEKCGGENFTCTMQGQCTCREGFVGPSCQLNCVHGTPVENYTQCACFDEYYGVNCTRHCRSSTTCHNNGNCTDDGYCTCDSNRPWSYWSGEYCNELKIVYALPSTLMVFAFTMILICLGCTCCLCFNPFTARKRFAQVIDDARANPPIGWRGKYVLAKRFVEM